MRIQAAVVSVAGCVAEIRHGLKGAVATNVDRAGVELQVLQRRAERALAHAGDEGGDFFEFARALLDDGIYPNHADLPLLVYQGLGGGHRFDNDRHHTFILEGARDAHRELRERGIAPVFHAGRDGRG